MSLVRADHLSVPMRERQAAKMSSGLLPGELSIFLILVQLHYYLLPDQLPGGSVSGFGVSSFSLVFSSSVFVSVSLPGACGAGATVSSVLVLPAPDLLPVQELLPSAAKAVEGMLTPARRPAMLKPAITFFNSFLSIVHLLL